MRSEICQVVLLFTRGRDFVRVIRMLRREKNGESKKDGEGREENAAEDGDRARVARPSEGQAAADFSNRSFEMHEH